MTSVQDSLQAGQLSAANPNERATPEVNGQAPVSPVQPREVPAASPPSVPAGRWRHRHVLDLDDFSRDEIEHVLDTTDAMREVLARDVPRVPALRGTTVATLFYEA